MRFFNRRGRSQSVERSAKNKHTGSRQHDQPTTGYRSDKRSNNVPAPDNESVGSELPTLDQFEIAVPSFANSSVGVHEYPAEAREDDADNRSCTDISSITSVSYRAGYYYLRNIKKKAPDRKSKQSGCLPSCSCAACMPCSCSWLSCCCCSEAKSELATAAATKQIMIGHPPSREKLRKSHSPGRRSTVPPGHYLPQNRGHGNNQSYMQHSSYNVGHRTQPSSRRYKMSGDTREMDRAMPSHGGDDGKAIPSLKNNHSLFDELSEEEEMGGYRGRQKQQYNQKRSGKNKAWLTRGRGGGGYGAPHNHAVRDKSGRSRSRGRVRRGERY